MCMNTCDPPLYVCIYIMHILLSESALNESIEPAVAVAQYAIMYNKHIIVFNVYMRMLLYVIILFHLEFSGKYS